VLHEFAAAISAAAARGLMAAANSYSPALSTPSLPSRKAPTTNGGRCAMMPSAASSSASAPAPAPRGTTTILLAASGPGLV